MSLKIKTGGGAAGCLLIVVILAIVAGIAMLVGALGIASADAWFFNANFSDGWAAAWAKPWVLLGWTVLFYGVAASLVFRD